MEPMTNDQIAKVVNVLQAVDYYCGMFRVNYSSDFEGEVCLCKTCYPMLGRLCRPISEIKAMADSFELDRRGKTLFFKKMDCYAFIFSCDGRLGVMVSIYANEKIIANKEWMFDGIEDSNRFELEVLFKFLCGNKSFRIQNS